MMKWKKLWINKTESIGLTPTNRIIMNLILEYLINSKRHQATKGDLYKYLEDKTTRCFEKKLQITLALMILRVLHLVRLYDIKRYRMESWATIVKLNKPAYERYKKRMQEQEQQGEKCI